MTGPSTSVVSPQAVLVERPAPDGGPPLRHVRHPGGADAAVDVVACRLEPLTLPALPAGATLLEALSNALATCGVRSAVLTLDPAAALRLGPFAYVLPALSRDPAHAVYFSERHQARGTVAVDSGTVTFGFQGDRPWLHGHLDWREPAPAGAIDTRGCGHVLPDQARLAADSAPLQAWALHGAGFEVVPDPCTGFSLFKPRALAPDTRGPKAGRPALAVRVPPNLDVCEALEAVCLAHGIRAATLRGGVGSTVGACFADGRVVEPFVTETLLRAGRVCRDADGAPRAELDVSLVDYLGGRHRGRLARGRNPVLVTFELALEITEA